MKTREEGSRTARNGFKNEDYVIEKFNHWTDDKTAQAWLEAMKYKIEEIEEVKAIKISGYKTDVQVQVTIKLKEAIDAENLQIKLVSNPQGFNQIDKRKIDKYAEMWDIPQDVLSVLRRYTGEEKPDIPNPRDKRRMFADEFSKQEIETTLQWLNKNKTLIVSDILRGQGKFAAEWMLVIQRTNEKEIWALQPINYCMNYFGSGDFTITSRGNFKIGRITMQRKGGDAGRSSANMLQFKINPAELLNNL